MYKILSISIIVFVVALLNPMQSNADYPAATDHEVGVLSNPFDGISMNGTWEGTLNAHKGPGLSDHNKPLPLRIIIQDNTVHVFASEGFKHEVKAGQFKIEKVATNAVIFATTSGRDNEGTWVETWAITLTQKDKSTLIAGFSRVVNNINLPLASDHSKFVMGYSGELKRT